MIRCNEILSPFRYSTQKNGLKPRPLIDALTKSTNPLETNNKTGCTARKSNQIVPARYRHVGADKMGYHRAAQQAEQWNQIDGK